MDIKAILAAAASVAKPEAYKVGENTIYIRRFTSAERVEFFERTKVKEESGAGVSKLWIIGFGLCDDKNVPLYSDPAAAETDLLEMLVEDVRALETVVLRKLGINSEGDTAKKS